MGATSIAGMLDNAEGDLGEAGSNVALMGNDGMPSIEEMDVATVLAAADGAMETMSRHLLDYAYKAKSKLEDAQVALRSADGDEDGANVRGLIGRTEAAETDLGDILNDCGRLADQINNVRVLLREVAELREPMTQAAAKISEDCDGLGESINQLQGEVAKVAEQMRNAA